MISSLRWNSSLMQNYLSGKGLDLSDLRLAPLNSVKTKASSLRPPLHKLNRPLLAPLQL